MRHWVDTLPIPIFALPYEALVTEQEKYSRLLVDFVGLPWEDACLTFQKTERSVSTPSRWQVRQPIYNSSVQAWRAYERHLDPPTLISALGDLASASP